MNKSIRDYNEHEFQEALRASVPDEQVLKRLVGMYEDDHTAIEREEASLHRAYQAIPDVLNATSRLTGLDQETLLTVVGRTSASLSLPWYNVLNIIRDYYVQLEQVRKEQGSRGA